MSPSTRPFPLAPFLADERERVEQALEEGLERLLPTLPDSLRGAVRHGVTTGGKRLRPILCVAAYRAVGGADEAIYRLAISLELVHAYSLMHDDLPSMDDAPLRRGRPTPHMLHGEEAALVGGAALIPAAALQAWEASGALGLEEETRRELVATLCRAAGGGGMVGGQALDLLGEGRALGRDELDGLHRRKTGALLSAALRMGALAGGALRGVHQALERYGAHIGLAFQIADDVLDATADAGALGKNPSDAELDKSTYVRLLGVDGARAEGRREIQEALRALAAGGVSSPPLEALARYVVERDR